MARCAILASADPIRSARRNRHFLRRTTASPMRARTLSFLAVDAGSLLLWLSGMVLASNGIVIALLGRLAHIY
jgi:hypothetical protein